LIETTICVIDDDPAVRRSMVNLVRSMGFSVSDYESAEAFLAQGVEASFDCVICDIRMGAMSGPQLLAHLRAAGRVMPFIFMTAYAHERHIAQATNNGAVCVLDKPIDPDTLEHWIDHVMRSRSATKEK
jgi:FixJ family two-component response regulator